MNENNLIGGVCMQWLSHLEEAVPKRGYGNRLSMYLISLEAWRRGLNVNYYYKPNPENRMLIRYSISNGEKTHHFESSRGDKLTRQAFEITENKDETKKYLAKIGVPVPEGKRFQETIKDEEIIAYADELGYPVVIKPLSENAGKGVFSNLSSKKEVIDALIHVRHKLNYKDIIVEKHIDGIEYRILLIDGKIQGIVNRIPANIVGDGINTIEDLINKKNRSKKINPNIASKLIEIDKEILDSISALDYTLESIPPEGEMIFLRNKSNVSTGGDPIDVTDEMPKELKELAVKAFKAIPGLDLCGLDMIVNKEKNTGVIIEINTKPMLGLHIFPVEGKPRDVVSPLLDLYFPETINKNKTNMYFDFDAAIAPIKDKLVESIEILPPSTLDKTYALSYLIKSDKVNRNFRSKIRLEALKSDIHGYIKEINQNKTEVVVASEDKEKVYSFKDVLIKEIEDLENVKIEEVERTKPIKIGFETYSISQTRKNIKKLRADLRESKTKIQKIEKRKEREISKLNKKIEQQKEKNIKQNKKIKAIEKRNTKLYNERNQARKELANMLQSRSWRLTKPLRVIGKSFKK